MNSNLPTVKTEVASVRATLDQMKPQLAMALPKHLTPDRLVRVALTAIQNTPKLLECDRTSLLSAIMTAAQLGLEPDGILGQAYLVPFSVKGQLKVQFIPGYKGLIKLARNSGDVTSIQAQAVHENDYFVYQFGLNECLDHKPTEGERGEITHFWALARFKDGGHHWDVMTRGEVEKIRDESQGYQAAKRYAKNGVINSPWVNHFEEMGRKTAIRRIAKYLPMDVQKAAYISDSYDTGKHTAIDMTGEFVSLAPAEEEEVKQIEGNATALDAFAAPETPHNPETGEVLEPELLQQEPSKKSEPVRVQIPLTEAGESDWSAFTADFEAAITGTESVVALNALMTMHNGALANLKKVSPGMHQRLITGKDARAADLNGKVY